GLPVPALDLRLELQEEPELTPDLVEGLVDGLVDPDEGDLDAELRLEPDPDAALVLVVDTPIRVGLPLDGALGRVLRPHVERPRVLDLLALLGGSLEESLPDQIEALDLHR